MKENSKSLIKNKSHNIHDNFFRESMSNMELAREFLEEFLDKDILDKIDLASLEKLDDKYVTRKNESYFTDALYSMKYDGSREGFLYILLEHKSYPAHGVIFQLLEYLAQIYQKHYNKNKGKVPIVIPIVVYHGTTKWTIEREFLKYVDIDFEEDKEFLKYIPNFFYKLYDIPRMEINGENFSNELKAFIFSLRLRNHKEEMREFIKSLDKVRDEDWFTKAFLYFVELLNEKDKDDLDAIVNVEILDRRDEIMTLAQSLREEGFQKGIEKGLETGVEKGKLQTALKLLKLKLDKMLIVEATDIPLSEIEKLEESLKN